MKLSEAMLKGIEMTDGQVTFDYLTVYKDGRVEVCALGAAAVARFGPCYDLSDEGAVNVWQGNIAGEVGRIMVEMGGLRFDCPAGCGRSDHIHFTVAHLNDLHRWTIERIAHWLKEQGL